MTNAEILIRLNTLWKQIYPHIARWIETWIPQDASHVIEIGPFSGGIIQSLLARQPARQGLIALSEAKTAETIRKSFGPPCPILLSPPANLPLLPTFDLLICRGAFFFLTPEIIKESLRILKPGGHALLGGGYGPGTPEKLISPIADESRDLNHGLGTKRRLQLLFAHRIFWSMASTPRRKP